MANAVSGMAASIRAATDNETFDLAGHNAANIDSTITDSFSQPFQLDQMIRITFVVGAGKLGRAKYDARAGQTLASSLRQLDFLEDRGASCVNECGGCYKTQHDTGKNVFTVVVFPRLVEQGEGQAAHGSGAGGPPSDEYPVPLPLAEGSPLNKILYASEETFAKMAPSMCPSWSEKKVCSEVLQSALETVEQMDAKLMTGTPLTDDENLFYDEVGGVASIGTKAESLRKLMHQQVEKGELTKQELDRLLEQVQEKIDTCNGEIESALQKSQEKKVAKQNAQKEKAEARKGMLEGHKAQPPHKLKHEAQIMKLRKKLQPLKKLEQSAKGRLMTMKETKELAVMEDILEEISELEEGSRGWCEDDEPFEVRLEASRKKSASSSGKAASGGKGKKPGTGSRSTNSGNTTWLTPGGLAAKQSALGKRAAKKPKPKSSGGVFAAMMMDSDSDSD
mmetsp:Transcript_5413/g.12293  ORF Transcript_5413/g.12293 Transcript_5413/m.12293 type:complete len:450 (-) Transcript_5413:113-1462(-)|eukprot:CAMPEP_0172315880 /NCGR_PEP_ID=MMETSP1058-20130122/26549_1 /TAXON_ID=83371 /ORGANISM="Detonula confervacea, Strain CCMP 353" /LENGTH=449 /DNA_ID=CAMNT_0013030063 /DNA_START=62 /DNA_END=1411 /DNA_ORIENTATION=+